MSTDNLKSVDGAIHSSMDTKRLDLSGLALRSIPSEVFRLSWLKTLVLTDNLLTAVPDEIANLGGLESLHLDRNLLRKFPRGITDLTNLRELRLDGNNLQRLPDDLGRLRRLQSLALNGNELTDLPSTLTLLGKLESLMLNSNRFTVFPILITSLRRLERLWISGNKLARIPPDISHMSALTRLDLRHNGLDVLPSEICALSNLQVLTVDDNILVSLPSQIGALSKLRSLSLEHNLLTDLPSGIGRLENLRELKVADNKLRALPRQLAGLLSSGLSLNFASNPISDALAELADRGADALSTYLTSLEDAVEQYEAKILLVGEGNVGKTSLVAALHGESFVDGRDTTHGIEIRPLEVNYPGRTRNMTLRTWDFGGQEVYRITHQFFFSKRALYFVVWSAREGQERNEVEDWLGRIRLRVANDAHVLVVATHCEERRPELDYPKLKNEFPEILGGALEVDNKSGSGIKNLRSALAQEAAKLPQMGQLVSPRWIATRDDIMSRAETTPQISFGSFASICALNRVTGSEVRTLAEYLHDLGHIIYYGDDEGLKDVVVLNPEWLTRAISYVLEDRKTRNSNGVLDHTRLAEIWENRPDGLAYPSQYHRYFLRLMEKFDVSYRLDPDTKASLVPQLLPYERPNLPWEPTEAAAVSVRSLSLICKLSEPAPGLIAWLTVRHHRSSVRRHWRNGIFLRYPIETYQSEALLELKSPDELTLDVRAPSPDLFFNVLRDSIENLIRARWPGITYQLFIPCPTLQTDGIICANSFPLVGLLGYREKGGVTYPCLECGATHDVSRLLTGFDISVGSLKPELERLETQVSNIARGVGRIEKVAAETAESVRRVLRIASTEVKDCPRLFTIAPVSPEGLRRVKNSVTRSYRITLWCEHTDHWHPWSPATYAVDQPREWVDRIRPYAALVVKVLKIAVPIAASVTGDNILGTDLTRAHGDLDLMTTIMEEAAVSSDEDAAAESVIRSEAGLEPVEGAALRAFRVFLFERDSARIFGGLRRVQAPSGELLWVCINHLAEYDPGLPPLG